jgi:hypothetical protein
MDATSEPLEDFKKYPSFKLEDELFSQAGGSVMDAVFGRKYQGQRKKVTAPITG